MRLEDLLNKPKNEYRSAGVYAIDYDRVKTHPETVEAVQNLLEHEDFKGSVLYESLNKMESELRDEIDKAILEELNLPEYLINDPEVVGYPDLEMQDYIYDWVINDLPFGGYTVKDLGAGRGDFFSKINSDVVKYVGFETKESLVIAGRNKYEGIELIHGDFFNSYLVTDYTICIGTLNEDIGKDKWEYFNITLNHAINSTKIAVIFILASNMDGTDGYLDYPFKELLYNLPEGIRFNIDYTRLEDIYKLTVHIGGYND